MDLCIYGEGERGHLSPAFRFQGGKKGRILPGLPGNVCFLSLIGSWTERMGAVEGEKQLSATEEKVKLAAEELRNYK